MEEPKASMLEAISGLLKSGAYSDFKIVCGSDIYNVHKNIICPQSEFFRAVCRPNTFQEGISGVLRLPSNPGRDMEALKAPIKANEFDWDLDVEDTTAGKLMIHYCYHHDYPSKSYTDVKDNHLTTANVAKGVLVVHSKMYAMADKYQVPGLKALAVRKFQADWSKTAAGLSTAIVIAFMSTCDTDQGLRQVIVRGLGRKLAIVKHEVMVKTVKEIPELVYALYSKLLDEAKT